MAIFMKIIFFGDSITEAGVYGQGYIVQMRERLGRLGKTPPFELVGAGVGGNKIYDLYLRCERDVLALNPDLVVIFIGVNDVWHRFTQGTGTEADKFEQFYRALIAKILADGAQVLLCTPLGIGEAPKNPYDESLELFADIIRRLAERYRLPLCDLRHTFLEYLAPFSPERGEQGILTTDGVHLNEAGNQLVANTLLQCLGHHG